MADIQITGGTPDPHKTEARQAMRQFDVALDKVTTSWTSLSVAERQEAIRAMVIIVARAVRWLMLKSR